MAAKRSTKKKIVARRPARVVSRKTKSKKTPSRQKKATEAGKTTSKMVYNSTRVMNGKGEKISVTIDGNDGTICSQSLPSGKIVVQKCTRAQALKKIEQLKNTDKMPQFPMLNLPSILLKL